MSKPGDSIRDSYLVYPGLAPRSWGVCHLRMILRERGTLLVVSEVRNNPGPSVTNAIEGIWAAIQRKYPDGILGSEPLLVEHYNDEAVYGEAGLGERLALVRVREGPTSWRHTTPEEIAELVGCAPEDLSVPLNQLIFRRVRGGRS